VLEQRGEGISPGNSPFRLLLVATAIPDHRRSI
jgi:hypothetical protein